MQELLKIILCFGAVSVCCFACYCFIFNRVKKLLINKEIEVLDEYEEEYEKRFDHRE